MSDKIYILLVDDDREIADLVQDLLLGSDYRVDVVNSAAEALDRIRWHAYDLLVIDVMMPGGSGFDLCREVRMTSNAPIILLTALSGLIDRVLGLELGADDYVTKPFEGRELLARIRALLRRTSSSPMQKAARPSLVHFAGWCLDLAKGELRRQTGELVAMSAAELKILSALAERPNVTMSRGWLTEVVNGESYDGRSRNVDVLVGRLRVKMQPHTPSHMVIETARNGGYVLRP